MISACEHGELDQNPHINEFMRTELKKSVQLCVTNETMADVSGVVRWQLINPDGKILQSGEHPLTVKALNSSWLDEMDFADASVTESACFYSFTQDSGEVSYGSVIFCAPKHYEFVNPSLSVSWENGEIVVRSQAYAKSVYIESDDPDMLLEDNFFDMLPGERHIGVLRGKAASGLRVRSVYDMDK